MRLTLDGDWHATVTDDPLRVTPRFGDQSTRVLVAPYSDAEERERFLTDTFGSSDWLWDTPDELRFEQTDRRLVGVRLQLPDESAPAEDRARVPASPAVRPGGLRADEARDFRLEVTTVLCCAPEAAELTCLRDLDVLDEPLEARVGIAPDVALLVQAGTVVGWSLTDPARYLTTGYAAPDPTPPSRSTRLLLAECLDLITVPVRHGIMDRDPAALARLRAADQALRDQREDRRRADALLAIIANLVEDYGS
ncbi:hypothetical protein [Streptomyces sp. NPDC093600]|uniref:hypothetical protein n=1 Tax=Streptomyces sp. NPDC093600 TaxID=3366047 RepID=UPI0037F74808